MGGSVVLVVGLTDASGVDVDQVPGVDLERAPLHQVGEDASVQVVHFVLQDARRPSSSRPLDSAALGVQGLREQRGSSTTATSARFNTSNQSMTSHRNPSSLKHWMAEIMRSVLRLQRNRVVILLPLTVTARWRATKADMPLMDSQDSGCSTLVASTTRSSGLMRTCTENG